MNADREEEARFRMVEEQLHARGITDARVLEAMRRVPRHCFVPPEQIPFAYEDRALPIGLEQTISQPYMVGALLQLAQLTGSERVLDVGTGSGYQAALLAELATEVVTIERHQELAWKAREILQSLGYDHIRFVIGDGSEGYPPVAPYDRILVAASSPHVPPALIEQLAPNGRLLLPVGPSGVQTLTLVTKNTDGEVNTELLGPCAFVPLIGSQAWKTDPDRAA
ncbi:MAG TPA: protein-L-isoaspartate(D-aspartate) O-methyltransferase [Chthonomonadaceae bacterium]|nr:protein-L-isoaspartate(D-aspartate) O-methyltransferase [Chthonomonadaceae bacterium]